VDSYKWWSIKLEWFKLIHVCKRWRTVILASSSRLELCFVLIPKNAGNLETIISHHFPPLPIDIIHDYEDGAVKAEDMGRMLAALKLPDRIRGVTLTATTAELDNFFRATNHCSFPALESLALRDKGDNELRIPITFLKGSNLRLRSLKLHHICLPSISRLLSSAPTLTHLTLGIDTHVGPRPTMSLLLSQLQCMPCLHHLDLRITSFIDDLGQTYEPKETFPLSKLTSFHFNGQSAFLNTLVAGFVAPSLRRVDIWLFDQTLPPIVHLSRFIEDIGEPYHTVKVILRGAYFRLLFFARPEYVHNYHSLRFILCTNRFPESIPQTSSAFSAKLTTMQELVVVSLHDDDASEESIPWNEFLLPFPNVKKLGMEGTNSLRIASVLHQGYGEPNLALLPALEEIELCVGSSSSRKHSPELEAFQPLVSARQQAGLPVKVFSGPPFGFSQKLPYQCFY
jgi:hypothetical protein